MNKHYEIYLAGAMKGLTWGKALGWREAVKNHMPEYIHTLSPLRGLEISDVPNTTTYQNNDVVIASTDAINIRDHNDVMRSDLVFVNLLDANNKSVGTIMEVAWARAYNKPLVIVFDGNEKSVYNHPMLLYKAIVVPDLQTGIETVIKFLSTDRQYTDYLNQKLEL